MASEQEAGPRQEAADQQAGEADHPAGSLTAVEIADRAREQLSALTGREADTVSSIIHDNGRWEVGVELVELARLPPSTDVLGTYQVVLGEDGELVQYERIGRYLRSEGSVTA